MANLDGAQLDLEEALEELPMEEPEPDTEGQLKPLDLDSTQEQPTLALVAQGVAVGLVVPAPEKKNCGHLTGDLKDLMNN